MSCSGDESLRGIADPPTLSRLVDYQLLFAQQLWGGMSLAGILQLNAKNY
jgi:hypothetical protein